MAEPTDTRSRIVDSARTLFAARGYRSVTIRQIAADANVSPALVMKLCASKADLYAEVSLLEVPIGDLDLPLSELGLAYVRRIERRRKSGVPEPWISPSNTIRNSFEPEVERARIARSWAAAIAERIDDRSAGTIHATAVACLLIGFAEGLRTIGFAADDEAADALTRYYAQLVQQVIDRAAGE